MQLLAKHSFLVLIAILVSYSLSVRAEDNSSVQDQLSEIEQKIDSLSGTANQKQEKIIAFQQQIKNFDQQIGTVSERRYQILQKVEKIKGVLNKLSAQDQALVDQIEHEKRLLGTHVTLAWQNQINSGVLLQADDNNQRLLHQTWLEYLSAQQAVALERIKDQNRELITLRDQQQTSMRDLTLAAENEQREQALLNDKKQQRQQTIAILQAEFIDAEEKISVLEQDRKELANILNRLKAARDDNAFVEKGTEFAALKGKLPWPHTGNITQAATAGHYIQANSGESVHAIAAGRIAYSEWLKGFGLLLILDHGDGYMSLYGNNESLYRKTGDWVSAGDVISATGRSGGRREAGLYFEIRANGKTVNARQWCNSEVSVNQINAEATNK